MSRISAKMLVLNLVLVFVALGAAFYVNDPCNVPQRDSPWETRTATWEIVTGFLLTFATIFGPLLLGASLCLTGLPRPLRFGEWLCFVYPAGWILIFIMAAGTTSASWGLLLFELLLLFNACLAVIGGITLCMALTHYARRFTDLLGAGNAASAGAYVILYAVVLHPPII